MYFPKLGPLLYSLFWVIPRRLNSDAGESPPLPPKKEYIIQNTTKNQELGPLPLKVQYFTTSFNYTCNYCTEVTEFYLLLFPANYPALESVGT